MIPKFRANGGKRMGTGRLVINGKTWGEFESAKRIKGHIVISGYESYGGCHTVRGIKQPELNEKQEYLLRELVCQFDTLGSSPFQAVYWLMHNGAWNGSSDLHKAITSLDNKQQAQVLRAFADWIEQEGKQMKFMDASGVLQKIQELKELYGDIEVMVKSNSEGTEFFKKIIDVDLQARMIDEEGEFIDEKVILIVCE